MKQALDAPPASPLEPRSRTLTLPRLWAFVAVALPVVASLEASMSSVDLAYQVRAGNLMLHTHHLLRHDTFTFTAAGRGWTDQQWGAQLLFALAWRAGGWAALALLRAGMVGAIYLVVYLTCRRAGASVRASAFLTLASFGVSVGGLALRPQLVGMALFAAAAYLVLGRASLGRWVWGVPVVVAIWANVHGSFFLGPLLLLLALFADVATGSPSWRRTALVLAASTAATFLNPFGLRVWSYAWGISTNSVITRFISEWQPPSVRDVAGASFFLSGAAVALLLSRRRRPTPWPTLLSLGVFFVIGLEALRGIFWWALLAPALVAPALPEVLPSRRASRVGGGDTDSGNPRLNLAIASAVVVLGIAFLPWWRGHSREVPSSSLISDAPPGVTAALRQVARPGDRVFNAQILGSWFELAVPESPMFVDARIEVFPVSVWRDYQDVSLGREGWQAILDRWRVTVVVANRGQQADLIPLIRRDPGWRLVHQDRDGLVFVRAS